MTHSGCCRRTTYITSMDKKAPLNWAPSKDGTLIAYEQSGNGPAVILVMGAFNDRAAGTALSQSLSVHFTVFNYDRRGRGDSGDSAAYAIEREIEDIGALIQKAGVSAHVFGYSSGAILALRAAGYGLNISRLALYDPPPTGGKAGSLAPQLAAMIAANRRGDAVELFQTAAVGIPAAVVANMRHAPFRPALEAVAHTLVYDASILTALPDGLTASINTPTLIIDAENMPPVMHQSAQSLAKALPNGQHHLLKGQTHDIDPVVVTPVLKTFFDGN
jgi:pimeloyl-ACP methyl ester carboxylesterase